MKFSYKLQELRKGSGMSQEEFAELLGVSRQSVSKWESGKAYPEIDKLIFISNYFNTSLDLLLKDETPNSDSMPSMSNPSKRTHISLTKHKDTPSYDSDPLPEHRTPYSSTPETGQQSYPLRSVRVASSSQVRPIKKHIFGNKKLSKKGIVTLAVACGILASGVVAIALVIGLAGVTYTAPYIADEMTSVGETYYDDYYDTYVDGIPSWEDLYDGEIDSDDEQNILDSMLSDEQSILMDTDGKLYYSGYDTIGTYLSAQWEMQCDLDCRELYEKYLSFKQNNTYLELYSTEYDEWVIINANMVYTYSEGGSSNAEDVYNLPNTIISYDDILSDPDYYKDCDIAPYYQVVRLDNNNSNALVSSDIFNTCLDAIDDRKILPMSQYINTYESFSSEYELVQYNNTITFVPKSYIMVNANSIDDNILEQDEEQEQVESVEIVEGVVEQNILDDDIVQEN